MSMASSTKVLKIKIIAKKPEPSKSESAKPSLSKAGHVAAAVSNKKTELGVVRSCGARGSEDRKTVPACHGKQLQSVCGIKRGPEEMLDRGGGKKHKPKMDQVMVRKCFMILKKLMTHPYGQGFNQPVDPVAFNIPDYFSVISKPMDLGMIKSKLVKDLYATASDFESDIRLTFSNAMLYNPPGNPFHKMAKQLNSLFSAQWRFVVSIMDRESLKSKADNGDKKLEDTRSGCIRTCSPHTKASPQRSSLATEKVNVKGSKQESVRKVPANTFRTIEEESQISKAAFKVGGSFAVPLGAKSPVQAGNPRCSSMHSDVFSIRPTESTKNMEPKKKKEASIGKKVTLCSATTSDLKASNELKKDGTELLTKKRRPTESAKKMEPKEDGTASLTKKRRPTEEDGTGCLTKKRRPTESTKKMEPKEKKEAKVPLSIARTSNIKAPSSDKKSVEETVHGVAKNHKPLEKRDSYANSEGDLSWLDEEPTFDNRHATFASAAFDSNDWRSPLCEIQLSPAKDSRAEMLKKRFANTILKAQKQTLLCPGEKIDQVKMEVEKQKPDRQHAQEKPNFEDKVKPSRDRQSYDSQLRRQREREAARIALEKMERSVEFEDSNTSLKDLAYMIGDFSFAGPLRGYGGMYVAAKQFVNGKLKSPLERLGLYLKEEDDDCILGDDQGHDREALPDDYEEGEILI